MDSETIKKLIDAFDTTEELFFISKNKDGYQLIHSELTDGAEWCEMIEHFLTKLEDKVLEVKKDDDALNDLLNDYIISSN